MIDVVWNNWVLNRVQMKKWINFHCHYQHSCRLMMRTPEYLWLLHRQTRPHRQSWGNVWKHAPNYLDLMCEQRFGSSLFGLVSHQVPNRDGLCMISSGWTNTKWRRRHRKGLGRGEQRRVEGGGLKAPPMFHRFGKEILQVWREEERAHRWESEDEIVNRVLQIYSL